MKPNRNISVRNEGKQSLLGKNRDHANRQSSQQQDYATVSDSSKINAEQEGQTKKPISLNKALANINAHNQRLYEGDGMSLSEAQQFIWRMPPLEGNQVSMCTIKMQGPEVPDHTKWKLCGILTIVWITFLIIMVAIKNYIIFAVALVAPLFTLLLVARFICHCDDPTKEIKTYSDLPRDCENYYFNNLIGIIDITSKLFFVYEYGVNGGIKKSQERLLHENRIYHQRLVLRLNDITNMECPGQKLSYRKGIYESYKEHFKINFTYRIGNISNYHNVNSISDINNRNRNTQNTRQRLMTINRYSVTQREAKRFAQWFNQQYQRHCPQLVRVRALESTQDILDAFGMGSLSDHIKNNMNNNQNNNNNNNNNKNNEDELKRLVRRFIVSDNQDIRKEGNELDYFISKYNKEMVNEYNQLKNEFKDNNDNIRKLLIVKGRNLDKIAKKQQFNQV